MAAHFDRELVEAFRRMPLAVMRADIWRYAVVYVNGGVYADIDAECITPLDSWLDGDAEVVLAVENDFHFCQWTFAAMPGARLLETCLELVVERWRAGIDTSRKHFVHYHTGPALWTEAVRRRLGGRGDARLLFDTHAGRRKDIQFLEAGQLADGHVRHHFASRHWRADSRYRSWLDDRERLFLLHHARPRRKPSWSALCNGTRYRIVHRRYGHAVDCEECDAWLFARCDGSRTVSELIAERRRSAPADPEAQVYGALKALRRRRLVSY